MQRNSGRIDFSSNPKVKELFSRKKVGDKVEFETKAQINKLTDEAVEFSVEEIIVEDDGAEDQDQEEGKDKPDKEEKDKESGEDIADKPIRMEITAPTVGESTGGGGFGGY